MITLSSILDDNTSGSSELVKKLNQYFLQEINNKNKLDSDIVLIGKKLATFTAIKNYLAKVKRYTEREDIIGLEHYIKEFETRENKLFDKLFQNSLTTLPPFRTVLTISNSNTLFRFFEYWGTNRQKLEIFVCESLPGGEGKIMANSLRTKGLHAKVIKDNTASEFIKKSDVVFLGADKILKDGAIVNKIGSKKLCLLSQENNIPVYVLSTKNKIELKDHSEIIFDKKLFEIVETGLITKIITD